ncbi:MAG: EF-hand domain-containing protein [Planctomycetota bacterium]
MNNSIFLTILICSCFAAPVFAQDSAFKALDSDSNGKVSVAEFKSYAKRKLGEFEKLEEFVQAVDANNDAEISEAEFEGRMEVLDKIASEPPARKPESKPEDSKTETKVPVEAKTAFQKIQKLVGKGDWKAASKLMTEKAQKEVVLESVLSAIGMTEMEMPIPVPALEDAIDEIDDALIKHKLADLDIDTSSMFKMEFSMGEDEAAGEDKQLDELRDEALKSIEESQDKILNAVEKAGRWQVVTDLWNAKKSSPLSLSLFNGEIKKSESDEKGAFFVVSMAAAKSEQTPGMMIQMMAPPAVIRMIKKDDQWFFDGRDEDKTAAAMEEFMKNMPQMQGMSEPRNDF